MQREGKRIDPHDAKPGTGVLGRMTDKLTEMGYKTGSISIDRANIAVVGSPGVSPPSQIVSRNGVTEFNQQPSNDKTPDIIPAVKDLNNGTETQSSVFGEMWSDEMLRAINENAILKQAEQETLTATFPTTNAGKQFSMTARLLKAHTKRGTDRDVFYIDVGGYDNHVDLKYWQKIRFEELDPALDAFRQEMKAQGKWDDVVVVAVTDFARTLTPNSSRGSDHAWGGNLFAMGGKVRGKRILGTHTIGDWYKDENGDMKHTGPLTLSRGRIIPTLSYNAVWNGVSQFMGIPDDGTLDYVLPNRYGSGSVLFNETDLFDTSVRQRNLRGN